MVVVGICRKKGRHFVFSTSINDVSIKFIAVDVFVVIFLMKNVPNAFSEEASMIKE